jgi:hypothetical protein
MATTTTNYGFDIPQSTDLVKDGATAIATLGQDIDTAMNTALGTKKAGMVLLNTTSFSGVSSQSINDVFSATYDNYKIMIIHTNVDNVALNYRMRVSGADNSTANYTHQRYGATSTSLIASRSVSQTSGIIATVDAANGTGFASIDMFRPFLAETTYSVSNTAQGTTGLTAQSYNNIHNVASSFTGFTFFPSSGNMTGYVSVYGYNK